MIGYLISAVSLLVVKMATAGQRTVAGVDSGDAWRQNEGGKAKQGVAA